MESGIAFAVNHWSAWAPGLDSPEAWRSWGETVQDLPREEGNPDVRDLPAGLRRRLSRLGKIALRVALDTGQAENTRVVFSSRNGNVVQTLQLLQSLAADDPISPTGFGMSVHNSLAGMLSIVTGNCEAQTAIAAGADSLCLGMYEALMLLREDPTRPVLLLHCDETVPEFYAPSRDISVPTGGLALSLQQAETTSGHMTFGYSGEATARKRGDPLETFLRFLLSEDRRWSWTGEQGIWWCERHA
ncbi:beta-ketoacyl synthase chain length factor [Sneathiella sp.]|uniref:beta-ketoacyl synthase chain length factor n=1 Tax=Sneathiella sp. TaxID=1964365 RepID=UPI00356A4351